MSSSSASARFPHTVIRASAGSGKTFQLSNRFIALLQAGAPPEQILATTFTRKAAAEILDRILLRLAEAADNAQLCEELGRFIQADSLTPTQCRDLLHELLRNLHRLHINTLDSFFGRLARSLSLEIGLPLAWQIIDELQDSTLRDEAIEDVIDKEQTSDLLTLTHLLTKGEASRSVGSLIRATVNDLESLYQESDEAAWRKLPHAKPLNDVELALSLEDLRTLEAPDKRFARARDADYQRALAGDWEAFITKGIAAKAGQEGATFYNQPIPDHVADAYRPVLQHARALLVNRVAMQTEGSYDLLRKFDAEYEELKRERRATRFSDITRSLAERLRQQDLDASQGASGGRLAFRLDGQIKHLLLDEFQDTAPAQWEVLRPFAAAVTQEGGPGSFFCVGDAKQAIYGWRGGVAEIFDAISNELQQLQSQTLSVSFRSAPAVIDVVNRVFAALPEHPNLGRAARAVQSFTKSFDAHETQRKSLSGYVSLATAGDTEPEARLAFAADRIAALHAEAPRHSLGVLVRRNQTVGRLIGLLRAREVFASEEGGNPLTDSPAVQLVLSLLSIADHPGDAAARFHVATSPLGEAVDFTDHRDRGAAQRLSARLRRNLLEAGYGKTLAAWEEALRPHCQRRDRNRLQQLVELASSYESRVTARADDFIQFVERERVGDPTTAQVRVMTIHQAKGLEFDIVVLPELEGQLVGQPDSFVVHRDSPTNPVDAVCRYVNTDIQQLLPPRFQKMFETTTDRVVTESLCVMYVAITRAVHALHMLIPPSAGNERVVPRTYAGLLRSALFGNERAPAGEILYQHGDPDWHQHAEQVEPEPARQRRLPARIQLAPAAAQRRRGLERQSPSRMEGGSTVRLTDVLTTSPSQAMLRGSIIHTWFEAIPWVDDAPVNRATLKAQATEYLRTAGSALDVELLARDFDRMLQWPAVEHLLSRRQYEAPADLGFPAEVARAAAKGSFRLVVECEREFALRRETQLLTGSIDRLVWLYRENELVAADVIDFKTDSVTDDGDLSAKTEFYRPQLEAYRDAVCRMSGLAPQRVLARLCFVGAGRVARVA